MVYYGLDWDSFSFLSLPGLPADCRMAVSQNFAPMETGLLQNRAAV